MTTDRQNRFIAWQVTLAYRALDAEIRAKGQFISHGHKFWYYLN